MNARRVHGCNLPGRRMAEGRRATVAPAGPRRAGRPDGGRIRRRLSRAGQADRAEAPTERGPWSAGRGVRAWMPLSVANQDGLRRGDGSRRRPRHHSTTAQLRLSRNVDDSCRLSHG
jgi:hypothetical protein